MLSSKESLKPALCPLYLNSTTNSKLVVVGGVSRAVAKLGNLNPSQCRNELELTFGWPQN